MSSIFTLSSVSTANTGSIVVAERQRKSAGLSASFKQSTGPRAAVCTVGCFLDFRGTNDTTGVARTRSKSDDLIVSFLTSDCYFENPSLKATGGKNDP